MPWTANRWPLQPGDVLDADVVMNEVRAALAERDRLVPVGHVPHAFNRWMQARHAGRRWALAHAHGCELPVPGPADAPDDVAAEVVGQRADLYTFANLCQDAFAHDGWSHDLTALDGQGNLTNRWSPACAVIFGELYQAINRLDGLHVLPAASGSDRHDSVYRLAFGITDWPADRADTFGLFDGQDDEQTSSLEFDVGLGGEVYDGGTTTQWILEFYGGSA